MKGKALQAAVPCRLSVLAVMLALISSSLSSSALAQDKHWYVGASVGKSLADMDTDSIFAKLKATGASSAVVYAYDDDTMTKVFAGYRFHPNFVVEMTYGDLGKFDFTANVVPAATQLGQASVKGVNISLLGTLPVANKTTAFARLGINSMRIGQSFDSPTLSPFTNRSDRGTHLNAGIGVEYELTDAVTLRGEVERFQVASNQITTDQLTTFSLGALYRFGTSTSVVAEAAKPAPPTVTPAPAPSSAPMAPAVVARTPPPLIKVALAANALFDFDKAELKPVGKQQLDDLIQDLKTVRYDLMIVTGNSDRIGKRAYNQALSERRANAVKAYLVEAGVPSANITAKGVGSDQPVTFKDQCQGPVDDALKTCLQPDRRVEVEVNGTRNP